MSLLQGWGLGLSDSGLSHTHVYRTVTIATLALDNAAHTLSHALAVRHRLGEHSGLSHTYVNRTITRPTHIITLALVYVTQHNTRQHTLAIRHSIGEQLVL